MTAEIAVLNQEAVALAADSAVTGPKIFTSANKIFALSKHHPVAVMVYNSAQFIGGVPWETIIKAYRRELGRREFPSLRDHAAHFLGYFDQLNRIFPDSAQRASATAIFRYAVGLVRNEIDRRLEALIEQQGALTNRDISNVTGSVINEVQKAWTEAPTTPSLPDDHDQAVLAQYAAELDYSIDAEFEQLPLTDLRRKKLRDIAAARVARGDPDQHSPFHSGVVIAGFGADDFFPKLFAFEFEAITLNRLKYKARQTIEIAPDRRASVVPFAQKEQVDTFMTGLDPDFRTRIRSFWHESEEELADAASSPAGLSDGDRIRVASATRAKFADLLGEYDRGVRQIIQEEYVWPIIRVVGMLPKDELAAMAEAPVNLTSFKRKISEQAETVGGPIDVAVISKGDGFIWIKRKHYFPANLNPQFFVNYHPDNQ